MAKKFRIQRSGTGVSVNPAPSVVPKPGGRTIKVKRPKKGAVDTRQRNFIDEQESADIRARDGKTEKVVVPSRAAMPLKEEVTRNQAAVVERLCRYGRGFELQNTDLPKTRAIKDAEKANRVKRMTTANVDAIKLGKCLLPKHELLSELSTARNLVRNLFCQRTMPTTMRGVRVFVLDDSKIDQVNMSTKQIKEELARQLEAFEKSILDEVERVFTPSVRKLQAGWPKVVEAAREALGDLFDPSEYVTADRLPMHLQIELVPRNLDLADEYNYVSESAKKRAIAQMHQQMQEAVAKQEEELMNALYGSFNSLLVSLTNYNGGATKVFKSSTVAGVCSALQEYRDKVAMLGICDSDKVQQLISKANKLFGTDSETLAKGIRESEDVRNKLLKRASKLQDELGDMFAKSAAEVGRRQIDRD